MSSWKHAPIKLALGYIIGMVRSIRVPFKSGVLPRPRRVVPRLLTQREQLKLSKISTTFSDPLMAPKGSSPNPPVKTPKTVEEKIALTAKQPKKQDKSGMSSEKQWRAHIADVRRSYYESSLRAFQAREERLRDSRDAKQQQETIDRDSKILDGSQFASPTIEASLLNEVVLQRTPEETEQLRLKREHNRLLTEKNVLEKESSDFLRLYQQASQFIVTEEQLESRVSSQFKVSMQVPSNITCSSMTPKWASALKRQESNDLYKNNYINKIRETKLQEAVDGTVCVSNKRDSSDRFLPGLGAVRKLTREDL